MMKQGSITKSNINDHQSRSIELTQFSQRLPRHNQQSISTSKHPSIHVNSNSTTRTKFGLFRRAVPEMPRALACLCFVLNLILPGTGKKHVPLTCEFSIDV
jgi:hypothetical protein